MTTWANPEFPSGTAGHDQYLVIGSPIAHSRSPQIHARFAELTGQRLSYQRWQVEPGGFAAEVDRLRALGLRGANVTLPFKQDASRYADQLSERAERAGAVNTLRFDERGSYGDNTDGVGLVRDLCTNYQVPIAGRSVLLLGAGGAARGALAPLLAERPARLHIANRTADKAVTLAAQAIDLGEVSGGGYSDLNGACFDLIINATSASLGGNVPELPNDCLASGGWCYDMMYATEPTAFMRWGQSHGARQTQTLDGVGMLVEQAAESFALWRGVRPPTEMVIADLRGQLAD